MSVRGRYYTVHQRSCGCRKTNEILCAVLTSDIACSGHGHHLCRACPTHSLQVQAGAAQH